MSNGLLTDLHNRGVLNLYGRYNAAIARVAPPGGAEFLAVSKDKSCRPAWLASLLAQNDTSRIYLMEFLASEVFLHFAMNLDPLYAPDTPQILVLNGGFGVGKTAGLDETLSRCGCHKIRIEPAELESPHAAVPAQLVREKYLTASRMLDEDSQPCALVLEDIHLSLGVDENTTKTINTQLVVATLMGFCDAPNAVRGTITHRVPVFATANDMTKVYGGLLRPGRTRVVAIEPSETDRKRIAAHILGELLTPEQVAALLDARPTWSIATFRQLKAELLRRSFDSRHRGKTAQQVLGDLLAGPAALPAAKAPRAMVRQEELENAIRALDAETEAKRDFSK